MIFFIGKIYLKEHEYKPGTTDLDIEDQARVDVVLEGSGWPVCVFWQCRQHSSNFGMSLSLILHADPLCRHTHNPS